MKLSVLKKTSQGHGFLSVLLLFLIPGTVILSALLVSGCGYSPGYKLPRGVSRISIPTFRNETIPFRKDLEFELTRSVRREFQLLTSAEVVSADRANATLKGTIIRFEEGVLVESGSGEIQESGILVEVGIQLLRTRDQRVLIERVVSGRASYSVASGEDIGVARLEAVNDIARRIIADIEPWSGPSEE